MIKNIKNIINLTKIFSKDAIQDSYIINKKTNKINKKSIFVWLLIIVMICVISLSYKIIDELMKINQEILFLHSLFLLLSVIIIFQVAIACTNVYFFSKDLELILPLPIKTKHLLIAKLNTLIINTYFLEFIFALFPLIIYGICTKAVFYFYIYSLILLVIFPILFTLIISIIMMFLMKLSKFVKNKDIFQIIITLIFIFLMFFLEYQVIKNVVIKNDGHIVTEDAQVLEQFNKFYERIKKANTYFLEINYSVDLLSNSDKINSIFNLIKIIFIDFIFFIIFLFIGEKMYLKNILKNYNSNYIKKIEKINLQKKCKKFNKRNSYILKEFKNLFKNPIFFMQCIYPVLIIIISLIIIMIVTLPNIKAFVNSEILGDLSFEFTIKSFCLILSVIQIIFTFSDISITSVSREGKDAIYMKFIPVDFYKQIIYKSMPQIIINMIFIFITLTLIALILPNINFIYYIYLFIIANILNILNSILMVIVDLKKGNIDWNSEYEVVKQNNNKLYQYVLTIFIVLLLNYFSKIFFDINLDFACILILIISIIILIIVNKIIKINKNRLFKKLN